MEKRECLGSGALRYLLSREIVGVGGPGGSVVVYTDVRTVPGTYSVESGRVKRVNLLYNRNQ